MSRLIIFILLLIVLGCNSENNGGSLIIKDSDTDFVDDSDTSSNPDSADTLDTSSDTDEQSSTDFEAGDTDMYRAAVTPNPLPSVKSVLNYINSVNGTGILSGQMESTWMDGGNPDYEIEIIKDATGRYPAIRGFDFMTLENVTNRVEQWWSDGGIPTICWHWGTPIYGDGMGGWAGAMVENISLPSGQTWSDFVKAVVTDGTAENAAAISQMSDIADELQVLDRKGIPVLWKPFHEQNGQWFWWGAGGAENFTALWRWMFNYMVNTRGLRNLIWVIGFAGGHPYLSWYPGDGYVDLAGVDTYDDPRTTNQHVNLYEDMLDIVPSDMPVALHENGRIPDPEECDKIGADWSWFMTWHSGMLTTNNPSSYLNYVYNHPFVITRDALPRF